MTAREWVLDIIPPAEFLSANSRKDRRGDDDRQQWRAASWRAAREAKLPTGLARVRIDIVIAPPSRRFDRNNLRPTCKTLVDGLGPAMFRPPTLKQPNGVSAPGYGLIRNDSDRHLDGEHLHVIDPAPPRGHVTIYIADLTNVSAGRTWTPTIRLSATSRLGTTKRHCNGCGEPIGDVTDDEIADAIAGLPLADVRSECLNCNTNPKE